MINDLCRNQIAGIFYKKIKYFLSTIEVTNKRSGDKILPHAIIIHWQIFYFSFSEGWYYN